MVKETKSTAFNVFIYSVLSIVTGLMISWGIWITDMAYTTKEITKDVSNVCGQIDKIQRDVNDLKWDLNMMKLDIGILNKMAIEKQDTILKNQKITLENLEKITRALKLREGH